MDCIGCNIKIGCCFKAKGPNRWLLINGIVGERFKVRDIEIEDDFYDEDIREMTKKQVEEEADTSICYRPYYHRRHGLYKVWDERKTPKDGEIILQHIRRGY